MEKDGLLPHCRVRVTSGDHLTAYSEGCGETENPIGSDRPDEDLKDIRASLRGEGEAYGRLVRRHQTWIAARMWKFTRNASEHEELVQEVFVQAYLSLSGFRGDGRFAHWLSRIATRVGYRYWKNVSRASDKQALPIEELDRYVSVPAHEMDAQKAAELLWALLEQLPPRDRLVLMLRYVEERTVEETAALTGWGATMVKVQSWRARNKLKRLMREAGLEVEP